MTNIEWLKDIFKQPQYRHIPIVDTHIVKWFAFKRGTALCNSKQADKANGTAFKLFVLEILYQLVPKA